MSPSFFAERGIVRNMVKTRLTANGVIMEQGSGIVLEDASAVSNVSPFALTPQTQTTTPLTLTTSNAGLNVLSASAGVLTVTLPTVASAVGALYAFRSTSPSAHVITSSQDAGNAIFHSGAGAANPSNNASQVTFPAVAGSSLVMMSDGANWLVLAGSGSFVYAKGV